MMLPGIHAEVSISDPSTCQVAPHSEGASTVTSMTKSPHPEDDGKVVEEFTLATGARDIEPDGGTASTERITRTDLDETPEPIFTTGSEEMLRFEREAPQDCVCEQIEQLGCPIREVNAVDGTLQVRFIAEDHDTLKAVLERLASSYRQLSVNRLLHSKEGSDAERLTLIDIGALTDRQREVLRRAHEMGYFEHPKAASAADVASALDIAPATFTEHLAAAQKKLLDELLSR